MFLYVRVNIFYEISAPYRRTPKFFKGQIFDLNFFNQISRRRKMVRWIDRKKAAQARMRFKPLPTTREHEDILRCNMNLAQDMAPEKKGRYKASGDETLDVLRGLTDKAKSEGLIVKSDKPIKSKNKPKAVKSKSVED
jgi:hypothetical protein